MRKKQRRAIKIIKSDLPSRTSSDQLYYFLQEAKEKIEKIAREKLKNAQYTSNELPQWTRDIADETKQELKNLGKDKRYKYFVQVIIGQNSGQVVRVGSRCFWDEDTDDCTWVSYMNDSIFCLVVAFAVYLY